MSTYCVIIREQTTDAASLAESGPRAALAAQGHSLKPLAADGAMEQLEGSAIEGAVILEFPDMAAARTWYHSPYRQAFAERLEYPWTAPCFQLEASC
jgi:uncharacterized protein (DUF1330 family)